MISPELIRRYPFFAGPSNSYIATLAKLADEVSVDTGHCFFREGDELKKLYLVVEGAVGLVIQVPDRDKEQPLIACSACSGRLALAAVPWRRWSWWTEMSTAGSAQLRSRSY